MYRTPSIPTQYPPEPKAPFPWASTIAIAAAVIMTGLCITEAVYWGPARREVEDAAEQARQRIEEKRNSDYAADCSRFNDLPQSQIPGRCLRHFGVAK
jgi:hypothetical protein